MYRQASKYGWEQLKSMLVNAEKFINANKTTLENAGQNMPAAFPAKFGADKAAFDSKYATYLNKSVKKPGSTNAKVVANNAVYTKLTSMLADGKLVFKHDEIKRALFTFTNLLSYITTAGDTGIHLKVVDGVTGLPVPGYTATFTPSNKIEIAGTDGIVEVKIPEATYSVLVTCPNYKVNTLTNLQVKTGIMKRVLLVLTK